MPSPDLLLVGYYDYRLVSLSILIAMLGSYSTIELGARVAAARGRNFTPKDQHDDDTKKAPRHVRIKQQ